MAKSPGAEAVRSRGQVRSHGADRSLLRKASVRMQEQIAVTALHQIEAETRKTHRPIAQVVTLPGTRGHRSEVKDDFGDLSIGDVLLAGVEGAQRKYQSVAALPREGGRIGPRIVVVQRAPGPDGGGGADFEEPVQWQENSRCAAVFGVDIEAQDVTSTAQELFAVAGCGDIFQQHRFKSKPRVSQFIRYCF
jgi:hypothetical protein